MRPLYLLIMIIFLSACQSYSPKTKIDQTPDYEKMVDQITAKTAHKIEAETGLRLIGIGGGAIDRIRKLNMSFQCFGNVTLNQARELLIYCVDEYLSAINSNEEIKPYLIHYPFTPKDIQVEIYIRKQDRQEQSMGALSVVGAICGVLDYNIKQPDPIIYKKIHKESYEEAVKILEADPLFNKTRKNTRLTQRA